MHLPYKDIGYTYPKYQDSEYTYLIWAVVELTLNIRTVDTLLLSGQWLYLSYLDSGYTYP